MSVEKSAFDFVREIEYATSTAEIEALFLKYTKCVGVEFFMCGRIYATGHVFAPKMFFGMLSHEWFVHYVEKHLFQEDAAVSHSKVTGNSFTWSDVISMRQLTKGEAYVMHEPRNFGLPDGMVIPLHGGHGELITFTVSGTNFVKDSLIEPAIEMMARTAFQKYTKIYGESILQADVPSLSKRQRECLMWVQHGKSNEDIADILNISPNTVKVHVEAAKRVFGVSTRVEAVVAGLRYNLLGP